MITRFLAILLMLPACVICQTGYGFSIQSIAEECVKGSAALSISGTGTNDTLQLSWSTGQRNVKQIGNLDAGDYSVAIQIRSWSDSILTVTDTSLAFTIEKQICPIEILRHFSPNDDGYNDRMIILNVEKHPAFELGVYNKWGQKVHGQKNTYIPWDGTWNGIPLPDGVYYIVFFFNSENKEKIVKSDVTILR